MGLERIAPNSNDRTEVGDTYTVKTEAHDVTLRIRRTGPHTPGYLISFVSAEPPITESPFYESEVIVKGHEVHAGKDFELSTLFPILTKTAFRAIEINSL